MASAGPDPSRTLYHPIHEVSAMLLPSVATMKPGAPQAPIYLQHAVQTKTSWIQESEPFGVRSPKKTHIPASKNMLGNLLDFSMVASNCFQKSTAVMYTLNRRARIMKTPTKRTPYSWKLPHCFAAPSNSTPGRATQFPRKSSQGAIGTQNHLKEPQPPFEGSPA